MLGSKRWVVAQEYSDSSGIIAIYGPFATETEAENWEPLHGTTQGGYSVHALYEAPEWTED
jgi:hypothetical protein